MALVHAARPPALGLTARILGMEAEEMQDAQIILANALACIADEDDAPLHEIRISAEGIDHAAVGCAVERVHGEVAPLRVR